MPNTINQVFFVQVEEIGDIEVENSKLFTEALENERERGLTDHQKTSLKKVSNTKPNLCFSAKNAIRICIHPTALHLFYKRKAGFCHKNPSVGSWLHNTSS